jgi:hypothetical protein
MKHFLPLLFLACTFSGFMGCKQQVRDRSNLFQEIFLDDSTTFRGTQMGEKMDQVLLHEHKQTPVRKDRIGLSYACKLPQDYTMLLDYYSDYLRVEQSEDKLASVVANILMNDEVETAKLYGEIQAYFNQKYGISSGQYGNYSWQGSTAAFFM